MILSFSFRYKYLYSSIAKAIPRSRYRMQQKIKATKTHCMYCFDVLISKLNNKPIPSYPAKQIDCEVPIFVTWRKKEQLRGCIGTFTAARLSKVLPEYAITSSMKDPRFPAVSLNQVKDLSVGVSFLVNFKQTKNIYDWQVGRHGIIIKALHEGYPYSGTFLPQVAKQQNWDQKQTLQYLVRKSGYYGKFQQIQPLIKLTTYESSKQRMEYAEYIKAKHQEQ